MAELVRIGHNQRLLGICNGCCGHASSVWRATGLAAVRNRMNCVQIQAYTWFKDNGWLKYGGRTARRSRESCTLHKSASRSRRQPWPTVVERAGGTQGEGGSSTAAP